MIRTISILVVILSATATITTIVNAYQVASPQRSHSHHRHHQRSRQLLLSMTKRIHPTLFLSTSSDTGTSDATSVIIDNTSINSNNNIYDVPNQELSNDAIEYLHKHRYVIIPNFLSATFQTELRNDINELRNVTNNQFQKANIGQDSTNQYNDMIRKTETCFIGNTIEKQSFNRQYPSEARFTLYAIIDSIRKQLSSSKRTTATSTAKTEVDLDESLTEMLYAYYPNYGNGYYRIHMDAVPNSISYLRQYSFLLYLSSTSTSDDHEPWDVDRDGGILRLYIPKVKVDKESAMTTATTTDLDNFDRSLYTTVDVIPNNGTLVLFDSHTIPHEVLDTKARERYVIVGWYNRRMKLIKDITMITPSSQHNMKNDNTSSNIMVRVGMLSVAIAMILYGVMML